MKLYVTSDLHLLHQNIIRYADRDVYQDTEEDALKMTYDIVNSINENVPDEPDVELWNLGDVFYGPLLNKQSFDDLKYLVSIMHGKNRCLKLVLGNHDFDFRYLDWKKATNNEWIENVTPNQLFRKFGFDDVYEYPIIIDKFIFSHEPVFLSNDSYFINVHGHTHQMYVNEDYFTWKVENHDMVKKAFLDSGRELPKNIDHKHSYSQALKVNPHKYLNVCWDALKCHHVVEINVDKKGR